MAEQFAKERCINTVKTLIILYLVPHLTTVLVNY